MQQFYPHDANLDDPFPDRREVYNDNYVRVFRTVVDEQPALIIDRSWLALYFEHVRDDAARASTLVELLIFPASDACDRRLSSLADELAAAVPGYRAMDVAERAYLFQRHYAAVEEAYALHQAARYPRGDASLHDDHDLVLVDADIAGCVSTFLIRNGQLDRWRTAELGLNYGFLRPLLPAFTTEEGRAYFQRLADMARCALTAVAILSREHEPD
ncbi:MAG TPA: hypothetical protein VD886_26650 [Herpetosiphonaceae bacterium]|nr:hypothetical protein [Herpetosiphonaceae bacterium]